MRNQYAWGKPLATVPGHIALLVKSKSTPLEKRGAKTVGNSVCINSNNFSSQRRGLKCNSHW